jgi:leucyl aminopeptidase
MQIKALSPQQTLEGTAPLIVGLCAGNSGAETCGELESNDFFKTLDKSVEGSLSALLEARDFSGARNQTQLLWHRHRKIMLVGLGNRTKINARVLAAAQQAAQKALSKTQSSQAISALCLNLNNDQLNAASVRQIASAAALASYQYSATKSSKAGKTLSCMSVTAPESLFDAVNAGAAVGAGSNLARELGNLPGNVCTPSYLAEQAQTLANNHARLTTTVLDEAEMETLGMGALLAVSRGSREPAKLITMEYKGAGANDKPVCLVGKGLTFDAGGISLKPGAGMDEMKYDMCGAAAVFGAMQMACELELPLNIVAVVPSSENLPDGIAVKPGDVVTSMAGKTIEILNTDAEGRLILCDALEYARRFEPEVVVDMATLTGACIIALGHHISGLLGNDDALADELLAAGEAAADPAWRLPINDDYQAQLKSNFADIANIGGRPAGTITAACFLARFTEDYRWAHLDIAGTAWKSGAHKGATGRPVPLLSEFLLARAGQA